MRCHDIDVAIGCKVLHGIPDRSSFALVGSGVYSRAERHLFSAHRTAAFALSPMLSLRNFASDATLLVEPKWASSMTLATPFFDIRNGDNTFDTGEVGYFAVCHRHGGVNTNQNALETSASRGGGTYDGYKSMSSCPLPLSGRRPRRRIAGYWLRVPCQESMSMQPSNSGNASPAMVVQCPFPSDLSSALTGCVRLRNEYAPVASAQSMLTFTP
ncbi:hypothetical protein FQR65_LT20745 [Abscondita terminalis]|nr:hypothetical protein FQR65_LT20745 [Abscondita terminalis]